MKLQAIPLGGDDAMGMLPMIAYHSGNTEIYVRKTRKREIQKGSNFQEFSKLEVLFSNPSIYQKQGGVNKATIYIV